MKLHAFFMSQKRSSDDGVCKLCVLFRIRQSNDFLLWFNDIQLKIG